MTIHFPIDFSLALPLFLAKMGGKRWTNFETAVVVYFASRRVDHEGCHKILSIKGVGFGNPPRSVISVRNRLDEIRSRLPLWTEEGAWNVAEVDKWLKSLDINLAFAVFAGDAEISCIAPVRQTSPVLAWMTDEEW